jgi:EipB-like
MPIDRQVLPMAPVSKPIYSTDQEVAMWKTVNKALVVFCAFGGSAQAANIDLLPHRAVYAMNLVSTQSASGIVAAEGTMSYEFIDACDGWVVENRLSVHYSYVEGEQVDTATDFVTWESKDGLKYRFRLRNTRDGQVTDEIEGNASLRGKNQPGTAHYTRPEEMTQILPKGTVFPTSHTREIVDQAQKGSHMLNRVVFDGSDTQGAFEVNALIGLIRAIPKEDKFPDLRTSSWPVRMAFFPLKGDEAEPDFEMAVDYHANGIVQTVMQGFKGFSLAGELQSLEITPPSQRCQPMVH